MSTKQSRWSLAEWLGFKKPVAPSRRTVNPYHAIAVLPGPDACGAAYRIVGQRFLSRHAPHLPLPTCDAFHCKCRYRHFEDRRDGPRRRSDIGLAPAPYAGSERRARRGRRKDDFTGWAD